MNCWLLKTFARRKWKYVAKTTTDGKLETLTKWLLYMYNTPWKPCSCSELVIFVLNKIVEIKEEAWGQYISK